MSLERFPTKAPRPRPVKSFDNLRQRIHRLLGRSESHYVPRNIFQLNFNFNEPDAYLPEAAVSGEISEFLNFVSAALPDGDIFIFGGLIRDIAFYGKAGFDSDVDLVTTGDWAQCRRILRHLGAKRNKFGGYRFELTDWPIDIWSAECTWAFTEGLVPFRGPESLLDTTVLNWDAILMNWRTQRFLAKPQYLYELEERILDVVLRPNPNPLGMLVRVLRHLCLKDARKITIGAAEYLAFEVTRYSLNDVTRSELASYGNAIIERHVFRFFQEYALATSHNPHEKLELAAISTAREFGFEVEDK